MCLFKVGLIMDRTSEGSGASPALSGIVIMRRWSLNPPNPPLTKGERGGILQGDLEIPMVVGQISTYLSYSQ